MPKPLSHRILTLIVACLPCACLKAQTVDGWHLKAVAEEQFNSDNGRCNLVSVIDYGVNLNLWRGGQFNVDALTTYMQHHEDYLSLDRLVFSNIDAESAWLRFYTLGISQRVGRFTLFAGVRSTVTDYFTDDEINFFTGSAHGIHPTLTENFDVATYPTSALAVQLSWQINDRWRLTTTVYNGESGDRLKDEFRLGGGIRNMTAVNHTSDRRSFEIGAAMGRNNWHHTSTSLYGYDIERLSPHLSLIGEASVHIGCIDCADLQDVAHCKYLLGAGGIYKFNERHSLGIIGTKAKYEYAYDDSELELNYAHTRGPLTIQPVLILDDSDGSLQSIALLRLTLNLGD